MVRDLTATACSIPTASGRKAIVAVGSQRIGVNVALPLRLTAAAAVGIALEAPIFVAITLVFALAGFLGAALEAWIAKPSHNQIPRANSIPNRPRRPQRYDAGRQDGV
jgi:hypothetical protein